ncbi:MAG: hypothetical protein Unbinned2691contig1000_34 [Prokaryotic dsDNA virus sp.]|mgnify:CR=1 FL=1|nr:MAG: hypothetical protein Unbinned2691contig1000_34 [Prokaryotic dsDNA virus sp.]
MLDVVISYKKHSTGDEVLRVGPKKPMIASVLAVQLKNIGCHSIKKRGVPATFKTSLVGFENSS